MATPEFSATSRASRNYSVAASYFAVAEVAACAEAEA